MEPPPLLAAALAAAAQGALPGPLSGLSALVAQGGALVLLLAFSGLCSAAEIALFSLTPAEREALAETPTARGQRVLRLLEDPRRLLVAVLLLNTVANVGVALLSARLAEAVAVANGWDPTAVLVLDVALVAFVILVVSELAPKLVASRRPSAVALAFAAVLSPFVRLVGPVAGAIAAVAHAVQDRVQSAAEPISSEDLKTMADVGEAQGSLEEGEHALIHSIVDFGETTVREIMVSRVDVTALEDTATLGDALDLIRASGHSRFPLYRESLDQVLGVVYAKDLLPRLDDDPASEVDWSSFARKPLFVPPAKPLDDMLSDFQRTNTHMAIVVDEYGGTAGLLTLDDLLEEVVGEIRDELDDEEDERLVHALPDGAFRAQARIDLDDLAEAVGVALPTDTFDFETLGGLILDALGRLPDPGDEVDVVGLRLRVETMEETRILDVHVEVLPETDGAARSA
ncbi:MAG TPA: hemolysin family protein, partial [Rubricoccaceae bacterium]